MARHIHVHRGPEHGFNLLRSFSVKSVRSVSLVDMATAVEAGTAFAPAPEAKPQHA